jgi:Holliday junction resolvase RusA-like endonuclease
MKLASEDKDLAFAIGKLRAIGGVAPAVFTLTHLGTPIPKERARAGGNGIFYTPQRTRDAQEQLGYTFRKAARAIGHRLFTDTVAIVAVFYVPTYQAKDTDNCMKLVMDAATKAKVWADDRQVKAQAVFFEFDSRSPRTVVAICPYLCSMSQEPLFTAAAERT